MVGVHGAFVTLTQPGCQCLASRPRPPWVRFVGWQARRAQPPAGRIGIRQIHFQCALAPGRALGDSHGVRFVQFHPVRKFHVFFAPNDLGMEIEILY